MGRGKASAPAIPMNALQKEILNQFIRNHSTPQNKVKRTNILLLASEGVSNAEISRRVAVSYNTVLTWRGRWLSEYESLLVFEQGLTQSVQSKNSLQGQLSIFLKDAKRSGAPKTFSLAQREQIVALCCESPTDYGLELTDWTHEMLAKTAITINIVESISPSHLGKILKKSPLKTS